MLLNSVELTCSIGRDRARVQHRGKEPPTSSNVSPTKKKNMVKKLCKVSEKINK